jgi:hypothetical protein
MEYFRIAVQVYLALGIGLACIALFIALIVTHRAAFKSAKQTVLDPIPLPEFRPGGDEGRDAPSSRS